MNINQLNRVMHIIGQRRLRLDTSSILMDEIPQRYTQGTVIKQGWNTPSTPKQFNLFQEYKNMLTAEAKDQMYEDRVQR